MEKKEFDLVEELQKKEAAFAVKKIKVMMDVEGILKTGQNTTQNYSYAQESEVVKCIRKAFISNNLSYSVECGKPEISHAIPTRSGEMKHFLVPLVCSLTDSETGLTKSYPWFGGAADGGDKALYKAYTSGSKYFLMKTFLLPTGDDVEAFTDVDQPPKNETVKPQPKAKTVDKAEKPKDKPKAEITEPPPESLKILQNVFTAFLINRKKDLLPGKDWDFDMLKTAVWEKYGRWPQNVKSGEKIISEIDPVDIMKDASQG